MDITSAYEYFFIIAYAWTSQNHIKFAHYIKKSHTFVGNVTKCDIEKHYFVNAGNAYTHYCEVESSLTGNLTAMVIGNSYDFFQQHSSVIITNHQHFRFRIPINAEYLRLKFFGYEANMNARKAPGLTPLDNIQLSVPCSKCLWINYNDFFCRNDYCTPIDPYLRLPMFLDEDHVTIIGARRAQDLFENITRKALEMIS